MGIIIMTKPRGFFSTIFDCFMELLNLLWGIFFLAVVLGTVAFGGVAVYDILSDLTGRSSKEDSQTNYGLDERKAISPYKPDYLSEPDATTLGAPTSTSFKSGATLGG